MANNENLKPFKPGQSGNPAGRKKGSKNRSTIAREWLAANTNIKNPLTGQSEDLSQEDIITLALIKKARRGNVAAYQALMDSAWGKPTQQVHNIHQEGIFTGIDLGKVLGSEDPGEEQSNE